MKKNILVISCLIILVAVIAGCTTTQGNIGNMPSYKMPLAGEAEWIRNGEPIEFEEELWYPRDMVDILMDVEVYLLDEFKGIQFFVEKIDVRPYDRLYTKFGRNKYRLFKKRIE